MYLSIYSRITGFIFKQSNFEASCTPRVKAPKRFTYELTWKTALPDTPTPVLFSQKPELDVYLIRAGVQCLTLVPQSHRV